MARELLWRARSGAPETTEAVGESLGLGLGPGALIALVGELGSGKTTLVRGLARGLGVREAVTSPTFTRMRVLPGRLHLYHFDAWRGGAEELFAEGAEFLVGEGVGVVEWADRVEPYLPCPRIELGLSHRGRSTRELAAWLHGAGPGHGPGAEVLERELCATLERAGTIAGLEILAVP